MRRLLSIALFASLAACDVPDAASAEGDARSPVARDAFAAHWYDGKAELARYRLEQARYGEMRTGDAVLVTVTEDFLPDRQVKSDSTDRATSGAWPILKVNLTKNFLTGLYPYSMMTSVFTPVDVDERPRSLKTTTSVQEWCGHTWLQGNFRNDRYVFEGRSYFESEGDARDELPAAWLEDELWTRIRIDPTSLPTGSIEMIPSGMQSRLRHRPLEVEPAEASMSDGEPGTRVYSVRYANSGRSLAITFEDRAPHGILAWEETYVDGFAGGRELTTRAVRTHVVRSDYWAKNRNRDEPLREALGLSVPERP